MKLHLDRADGRLMVTGYGPGYVALNGTRYNASILVLPERTEPWAVTRSDQLSAAVAQALTALPIEVLILGTGARLVFPRPGWFSPFAQRGIGLEVMDTRAACRTYNILVAEDRKVAAALMIEPVP